MESEWDKLYEAEKVSLIKKHGVHIETLQYGDLFIEIYSLDKCFNYQFGEIHLDLNEYAFKEVKIVSTNGLDSYLSDIKLM